MIILYWKILLSRLGERLCYAWAGSIMRTLFLATVFLPFTSAGTIGLAVSTSVTLTPTVGPSYGHSDSQTGLTPLSSNEFGSVGVVNPPGECNFNGCAADLADLPKRMRHLAS
jgi:hypothetical protein